MRDLIYVRENGDNTGNYTPSDKRDTIDKFKKDQIVLNRAYNFSMVFDILIIATICLTAAIRGRQINIIGDVYTQLPKFALVFSGIVLVCALLISLCTLIKGLILSWFVNGQGLNTSTRICDFHDNNARYVRQYGDYLVMSDWDAVEDLGHEGRYLLLDKEHSFVVRRLNEDEYIKLTGNRPKFLMFNVDDCENLELIR